MGLRLVIAGMMAAGVSWGAQAAVEESAPARMLGKADPEFTIQSLPSGRFRAQMESLPYKAQARALAKLKEFEFPPEDVDSLHADASGGVCYSCEFHGMGSLAAATPEAGAPDPEFNATVPISPFPTALHFHSRPGATNILYLDFDGQTITGTVWNVTVGRTSIPARPFSIDTNDFTFTDSEQTAIKRIWQRVAEDYAPFDIDVTTERPATITRYTVHVLVTRSTDANGAVNPFSTAGGVSYVSYFGAPASTHAYYCPTWVYINNLTFNEGNIGEASSHEAGHFIGLSHDGKIGGSEYYFGHGTGDVSWAPIMGRSYGLNVTQWSKGEYYQANNTQDDLAILAGKLGYIPDAHGDNTASATPILVTSNATVVATTPETDPANASPANKGVLLPADAADVWSFQSGNGDLDLVINPWISPGNTKGGNLDIAASLLNSNGVVIASSNPTNGTGAAFNLPLTAGVYYVKITKTSTGSPLATDPTGFTDYASMGQYFITGSIPVTASSAPPETFASLSCTLSPAEAIAQGAAWRIVGAANTNWWSSGAMITGLPENVYTVEFRPIAGWTTPTDEPIALSADQTGTVSGVYVEITTEERGVPVWWLIQNGFTNDPDLAINDIGANGMAAWESFIAGVDPNDPDSAFRFEVGEVVEGTGDLVIRWSAAPGRIYSLYRLDEPGQPPSPIPGAQDLAYPRDAYTNDASGDAGGVLQIRVELE